jgi:hypothetical protein
MQAPTNGLNMPQTLDPKTMTAVSTYLGQIQTAGFVLGAHQTDHQTAMNITKGQSFGRGRGVRATMLYTSPQSLQQIIQKMHATGSGSPQAATMNGAVHRGSNGIVVMAVPKAAAGRSVSDLEDNLTDAMMAQKIPDLSLPNQYIVGFWRADGQFFGNSRFQPKGGPLG